MSAQTRTTLLLATDQQQSVLNALGTDGPRSIAYTPYGHRTTGNGLLSLLGFNGEPPDALTGHYHLGNGYRQFNPVLMRFNSPDSWSPFGEGGLNAYAYCAGDPINRTDPTGHFWGIGTALAKRGLGWKAMRPKTSHVLKNVAMGDLSGAKNRSLPSRDVATTTGVSSATPLELVSHPDDVAGSAAHKKWLKSQVKNKQKNLARKSKDTQSSEPHSSKHMFENKPSPSPSGSLSERSLTEFLSSTNDAELNLAYAQIRELTKNAAFPRELKIGAAMEQEIIRRITVRSIG